MNLGKPKIVTVSLLVMALLVVFLSSAAASPSITSAAIPDSVRMSYTLRADRPSPVKVNIRSPGSGENLLRGRTVNIIAEISGTFAAVKYKVDRRGAEVLMTRWGSTNRYIASWTITQPAGIYRLYVTAYAANGRSVGSKSTTVNVVTSHEAELWYEIDFFTGHAPTSDMLDYWVSYWDSRAITVHPVLNDEVCDSKYAELTTSLFWEVEGLYNDDLAQAPGDDRAYGNINNGQPLLQEKWMFWGAYWHEANIGGFCYVWRLGSDGVGGNYIYINDGGLADWEASHGLMNGGGRTVALLHETGHSVGVIVFDSAYNEVYDPDYYSAMAIIRSGYNAAFTGLWYYSQEYWRTRNLGYY